LPFFANVRAVPTPLEKFRGSAEASRAFSHSLLMYLETNRSHSFRRNYIGMMPFGPHPREPHDTRLGAIILSFAAAGFVGALKAIWFGTETSGRVLEEGSPWNWVCFRP
jgi:hypothetical protein